jgi:hypothetical protein
MLARFRPLSCEYTTLISPWLTQKNLESTFSMKNLIQRMVCTNCQLHFLADDYKHGWFAWSRYYIDPHMVIAGRVIQDGIEINFIDKDGNFLPAVTLNQHDIDCWTYMLMELLERIGVME